MPGAGVKCSQWPVPLWSGCPGGREPPAQHLLCVATAVPAAAGAPRDSGPLASASCPFSCPLPAGCLQRTPSHPATLELEGDNTFGTVLKQGKRSRGPIFLLLGTLLTCTLQGSLQGCSGQDLPWDRRDKSSVTLLSLCLPPHRLLGHALCVSCAQLLFSQQGWPGERVA